MCIRDSNDDLLDLLVAGEDPRRVHPDGSSGKHREGFLFAGAKSSAIAGGSDDHANFAHVGFPQGEDVG